MGAAASAGWALLGGLSSAVAGSTELPSGESYGLRTVAEGAGLLYGAAVDAGIVRRDAAFAARVGEECGIIVPQNDLKWATLRPTATTFDFTKGDQLADFARRNSMLYRGHTLVWHQNQPSWFSKAVIPSNAEQVLVDHIQTVVGHYAGRMHSWDVVNEVINLADDRLDGLRNSAWLRLLGPDYIPLAFETAAAADPAALLSYNEFGLEYDEAKREEVMVLLESLISAGTPIHALGVESHLDGNLARFNTDALRRFFRNVAALGLKIFISEMDVSDVSLPADTAVRDQAVADVYEAYLVAALDEPAVAALLTWGLSDRYPSLAPRSLRTDRLPDRPDPLDSDLNPKPAWSAIARAIQGAPPRSA